MSEENTVEAIGKGKWEVVETKEIGWGKPLGEVSSSKITVLEKEPPKNQGNQIFIIVIDPEQKYSVEDCADFFRVDRRHIFFKDSLPNEGDLDEMLNRIKSQESEYNGKLETNKEEAKELWTIWRNADRVTKRFLPCSEYFSQVVISNLISWIRESHSA